MIDTSARFALAESAVLQCAKCGRDKDRSLFTPGSLGMIVKSGLQPVCRDCYNKNARDLYAKKRQREPGKVKAGAHENFKKFYATPHGRVTHLFHSAKTRSKRFGVPFDLTREWIAERLERGCCEVTGLPFTFGVGGGIGHRQNSFSPSIDRIKQGGGYTRENCRVVVFMYNWARGAFPDEHFARMLDALIEKRQQVVAGAGDRGSLFCGDREVTPCC